MDKKKLLKHVGCVEQIGGMVFGPNLVLKRTVTGLEPRTTSAGGQDIIDREKFVKLEPFCEYRTRLNFEVKER